MSISGKVTTPGGTGIANIYVIVFDINHNQVSGTNTDGCGNYAAQNLSPGNYKVMAQGICGEAWYNNKGSFATANTVVVAANASATGIDIVYPATPITTTTTVGGGSGGGGGGGGGNTTTTIPAGTTTIPAVTTTTVQANTTTTTAANSTTTTTASTECQIKSIQPSGIKIGFGLLPRIRRVTLTMNTDLESLGITCADLNIQNAPRGIRIISCAVAGDT